MGGKAKKEPNQVNTITARVLAQPILSGKLIFPILFKQNIILANRKYIPIQKLMAAQNEINMINEKLVHFLQNKNLAVHAITFFSC